MKPLKFRKITLVVVLCIGLYSSDNLFAKSAVLPYKAPTDKQDGASSSSIGKGNSASDQPGSPAAMGSTSNSKDSSSHGSGANVGGGYSDDVRMADNTCSCASQRTAYALGGASLLGLIIFLSLYLKERNRHLAPEHNRRNNP